MQWALGFAGALAAYSELKSAVYGNGEGGQSSQEASKRELFNCLKADGKFTKKVERLGFGSGKMRHNKR